MPRGILSAYQQNSFFAVLILGNISGRSFYVTLLTLLEFISLTCYKNRKSDLQEAL